MEALTAVSVAALTVYDMCKSVDRGMTIGRSGSRRRRAAAAGRIDGRKPSSAPGAAGCGPHAGTSRQPAQP